MVRDGKPTQLVNPHKPDRSVSLDSNLIIIEPNNYLFLFVHQDEKERISALGGEVIFWDGAYRVNGQLAVSRAIGVSPLNY